MEGKKLMKKLTDQQWKKLQLKAAYWAKRHQKLVDKGDTSSSKYLQAFYKDKVLNRACDIVDGIDLSPSVEISEKDKKAFFDSLPPKVKKWVKKHNKNLDISVEFLLNSL